MFRLELGPVVGNKNRVQKWCPNCGDVEVGRGMTRCTQEVDGPVDPKRPNVKPRKRECNRLLMIID